MTRTNLAIVLAVLLAPSIATAQAPPDLERLVQPAHVPPPSSVAAIDPTAMPFVVEPSSTETRERLNAPLFTTGAVVFFAPYAASLTIAGHSDHVGADRLYVPVAGPWLALQRWGDCFEPTCDRSTSDTALLVVDGVVQAAGVVAMLDALFEPSHRLVVHTADTRIHFAPRHDGLTVFGRF
jgi:hypothetical protein